MTDVIAHRGIHLTRRENTVDAFRAARGVGADGVELDVRRSADGILVVHHDARLVDGRAIVGCMRADLPSYVPTLADALDACAPLWVNIEIKNDPGEPDFDAVDGLADAVIAHLTARAEPASQWLISSFNRSSIDRCRALDPSVATAWLTADPVDGEVIDDLAASGHTAVHPWDPTVDAVMIGRCHDAGLRVNTWTCNDADRASELAGWGIDGICTDIVADVVSAQRAARPIG